MYFRIPIRAGGSRVITTPNILHYSIEEHGSFKEGRHGSSHTLQTHINRVRKRRNKKGYGMRELFREK